MLSRLGNKGEIHNRVNNKHFHVFKQKYQYLKTFIEGTMLIIEIVKFSIIFSVRISLLSLLLESVTMCDSPVMLPSNHQMDNILTKIEKKL